VIRLRDVTKTYATDGAAVQALRGITLEIPQGALVAIMGSSGSGKSTLMNILGCLDRPTAGTYELDGQRVDQLDGDARATVRNQKLGFVFQSFNLLPRTTAVENVALPLVYAGTSWAEQQRRAGAALDAVGMAGLADRTPNQLSGGQQQRVAIARAIVSQPPVLLADEPTGNLDSTTSREIIDLLCGIRTDRGTTVAIVTHDPEVARRTERVIVLRDGSILADGSPATTLADRP
jgi:putative ABC transport system ATP-binding protein